MKKSFFAILLAGILTLVLLSCQPPTEPIPLVPTNVSAIPLSQSSIRISWGSGNAKSEIYRDGNKVAEVEQLEFVDGGLNCGTTYRYSIRGVNGTGGKSDMSDEVFVETDQCTPGAPSGVSGSPTSQSAVSISWTRNSPFTETGIRPIWKQTDVFPEVDWNGPQSPPGSTSGIVSGLPAGRTGLPAAVAIVVTNGRWYFSAEGVGTTAISTDQPTPENPIIVRAATVNETQVIVYFIDNSSNESGFRIRKFGNNDLVGTSGPISGSGSPTSGYATNLVRGQTDAFYTTAYVITNGWIYESRGSAITNWVTH